jgi:putative transposase
MASTRRSFACRASSAATHRRGAGEKSRRSRRLAEAPSPLREPRCANELWTIDYKGQFRTSDGAFCYPLTVVDAHSRYLLGCEAHQRPCRQETQPSLERLFLERGLPERIRSDNGSPFASTGAGRLSRLSVWWLKLGIVPERIEPGKPQQNGKHQRMHRTLKAETARPPAANRGRQQRCFDRMKRWGNSHHKRCTNWRNGAIRGSWKTQSIRDIGSGGGSARMAT